MVKCDFKSNTFRTDGRNGGAKYFRKGCFSRKYRKRSNARFLEQRNRFEVSYDMLLPTNDINLRNENKLNNSCLWILYKTL